MMAICVTFYVMTYPYDVSINLKIRNPRRIRRIRVDNLEELPSTTGVPRLETHFLGDNNFQTRDKDIAFIFTVQIS